MSFPPFKLFLIFYLIAIINSQENDETDMNYNKLDIFICTHQAFNCPVTNRHYKILVSKSGMLNNDSYPLEILPADYNNSLQLLEHSYSELYNMNYIYEYFPLKKYVGFVRFNRYFSFFNTIPNLDDVFENHDIILPSPFYAEKGVADNWNYYHNIEDLNSLGEIIAGFFPDYMPDYKKMVQGHVLVPWNMFIMKSEDFMKYMEFEKSVLDIFNRKHNFTCDEDVKQYIYINWDRVYKSKESQMEPKWHQRIQSFLSERIATIYYWKNFKNPLYFETFVPGNDFRANENPFAGPESVNGIEGVNLAININRTKFNKEQDEKDNLIFDDKFNYFVIFLLLMGKIIVRTGGANEEEELKRNKKDKSKGKEKLKAVEKKKFSGETSQLI